MDSEFRYSEAVLPDPAAAPSVSLFIPVRNGENYLERCITSILAQTFSGWTLRIQDNGSTDGTARVVERFLQDPRISYTVNSHDLGMIGNFNLCLERVASDYYALLSHDDYFCSPEALALALEAMAAHPELGTVYSDVEWVDGEGRRIAVKRMPFRGKVAGWEVARASILTGRNHFGVPVLTRASCARGLRYDPDFLLTADVVFSIACIARAPAYFLPVAAVAIRFHAGNGTMRSFHRTRQEFEALARRHELGQTPLGKGLLAFRFSLNTLNKVLFFLYLDHLRGRSGRQLWAFILVGSLNTLLSIASYGLLLRLGLPFPAASGLSLALGVIVGFHAHRRLVFQRPGGFLRYVGIWLGIYVLANAQIWALRPALGPFWAGVAALPLNTLASYSALKRWVFGPVPGRVGP